MSLSAKLELKHGQQLVMTPQLQQAIKLLQLSNFELSQFVETELERNPLLERDDSDEDGDAPSPSLRDPDSGEGSLNENNEKERLNGDAPGSDETAGEDTWTDLGAQASDPSGTFDTELENVYPDTSFSDISELQPGLAGLSGMAAGSGNATPFSSDDINLEAFVANDISLRDHLNQQLPLVIQDPLKRLVGQYLIDFVDDSGYLRADVGELADRLGASESLVMDTLALLQTFDPPGVFARSLGECLAIQLKEQNRFDPQIAGLLDNLELLGAHDLLGLKKAVGVSMQELSEMIVEIKGLNPKPGLQFGSVQVQPVVPDVMVKGALDGSFLVELNSETLPRVLVNRSYYSFVRKANSSEKDKVYLTDCLQSANWLVKSLDQRARTILKVAEEIVRQQDGFFMYGVTHLRPLNLKTVAKEISMHESTVSRVTSNKYMETSRGVFEMKYFFTSAIAAAGEGEAYSSESVRYRIKELIGSETASSVLSDDKIVEILKKNGIDIARRTVAKYRECMGIRSSVHRRREKKLSAQMADGVQDTYLKNPERLC